ncbi:MAG: hypothetical protein WC655_19095, partial [Candidatus Hydrogenedentales bacterium]
MANIQCPKCGSRVMIEDAGDANSAMCPYCGESILVASAPLPPHTLPPAGSVRPPIRVAQTGPAPDAPNDGMAV